MMRFFLTVCHDKPARVIVVPARGMFVVGARLSALCDGFAIDIFSVRKHISNEELLRINELRMQMLNTPVNKVRPFHTYT